MASHPLYVTLLQYWTQARYWGQQITHLPLPECAARPSLLCLCVQTDVACAIKCPVSEPSDQEHEGGVQVLSGAMTVADHVQMWETPACATRVADATGPGGIPCQ